MLLLAALVRRPLLLQQGAGVLWAASSHWLWRAKLRRRGVSIALRRPL